MVSSILFIGIGGRDLFYPRDRIDFLQKRVLIIF